MALYGEIAQDARRLTNEQQGQTPGNRIQPQDGIPAAQASPLHFAIQVQECRAYQAKGKSK